MVGFLFSFVCFLFFNFLIVEKKISTGKFPTAGYFINPKLHYTVTEKVGL